LKKKNDGVINNKSGYDDIGKMKRSQKSDESGRSRFGRGADVMSIAKLIPEVR